MPEVNVDESKWKPHRQCEIRRPSQKREINGIMFGPGYFFDIVWIEADLVRVGAFLIGDDGEAWTVAEVHGIKKMPSARLGFKRMGG